MTLLLAALVASGAARAVTLAPTVHIKDFSFVPATLTVTVGSLVRFVNDDRDAHTVTSRTSGGFDSGGLDTGDSWTHRFTKAGTYAYFCALHPYMRGAIVVRPVRSAAR